MTRAILGLAIGMFGIVPPAVANDCILMCVGVRASSGVSVGGGQGTSSFRLAPLVVSAQAETAIGESPRIGLLGGALLEMGGRLGVGGQLGVRGHSSKARARFGGTVDYMFAPYALVGVGTELGTCRPLFGLPGTYCVDFRFSVYFAGDDLPDGQVLAQFGLVLGGEFDVE